MNPDGSVAFFDRQFQQQVLNKEFQLNPFELQILPHLRGRVLDFGCGMGNLSMAAAAQGCSVLALDASPSAISHLQRRAAVAALPVEAIEADLRRYELEEDFDCVVSIGLLMFFDCPAAFRALSMLQTHVRPGGIAAINVLIEGTSYLDMFQPGSYCLFPPGEMERRFAGWSIIQSDFRDFDAPGQRIKAFATLIAQKRDAGTSDGRE